jgi:hypothetical protein
MLKIKAGVRHLKTDARTRAQDRNWHVWVDGENVRFMADSLDDVRCFYADCVLISIQGNTVSFEAPSY